MMMKFLKYQLLLVIFYMSVCCSNTAKNEKTRDFPNSSSVYSEINNNDTLLVCNYDKVSDKTFNVPLSMFIDTCRIVRLENSEHAFVKATSTIISSEHIGVRSSGGIPFKLFSSSGKFIRNIGSIGRGPFEYQRLYCEKFDINENSIYLLPWDSKKILKYNFLGEGCKEIKLKHSVAKGCFFFKNDTVTLISLPFSPQSTFIQSLTEKRGVISEMQAGHLALFPDYSTELFCSRNTKALDFHLSCFNPKNLDTLYHYKDGKAKPVFSMNFSRKIPLHNYFELPNHFVTIIKGTVNSDKPNVRIGVEEEVILIDKRTLEAKRVCLINDYFGNLPISFDNTFVGGKYIQNIPAIVLKELIDRHLKSSNGLGSNETSLLKKMNIMIEKEDNNVVFFGHLN